MRRRTTAAGLLVAASAACQTLLDFRGGPSSDGVADAAADQAAFDGVAADASPDTNDASGACVPAPLACDGGACAPIVLVSNLVDPTRVVAEPKPCGAGNLAWLTDDDACPDDGGAPRIHLTDKDGGNARSLSTPGCVLDLAADGDHVFWAAYTSIELATWDGATRRTLATGGAMYLVGLSRGYVYWGGPYSTGINRNRIDAVGCGSQCEGFEVGATVNFLGSGPDLYLTHPGGASADDVGWVKRLAVDGGFELVADNQDNPHAVLVAGPWIFWAARGDIHRAALDGGTDLPIVVSTHVNAMVSDGTALFWTTSDGTGEVRTSDFDGNARVLAKDQARPAGIALDDTAIYWVNRGSAPGAADGALMKLTR